MNPPYIATHSGAKLYADSDQPDFRIIDVAQGLSLKCRWGGQCNQFYSVAQHAIMVAEIMQKLDLGDPFEGLHHDDTEAYLPDMPTPWKSVLPDFKAAEDSLERQMRAWLKLPLAVTPGCKIADGVALLVEARSLTYNRGELLWGLEYYAHLHGLADAWPDIGPALSPAGARTSFLFTHDKLLRKRK